MSVPRSVVTVLITCLISLHGIAAFSAPHHHNRASIVGISKKHKLDTRLFSSESEGDDFWAKQKELMEEMSESANESLRIEEEATFTLRRNNLLGDTAYLSVIIFAVLWGVANTVFTPISYAFGTICGLAYSYGLSKYVESIGRTFDEQEAVEGSGVGQARFAFLFLLILFIGKYRSFGLQEIPAILGFFTYQLSTLGQGLRDGNE